MEKRGGLVLILLSCFLVMIVFFICFSYAGMLPPLSLETSNSQNGLFFHTNESIWFYAHYVEYGSHIPNATCNISFNDSQNSWIMNEYYDGGDYAHNYSRNFSNEGEYIYTVICNASGFNTLNISKTVDVLDNVTPKYQTFNASTTNFSLYSNVQIENISDLILEKNPYGKIKFNEIINASRVNFDRYVYIENRTIGIESAQIPALSEKPATITFYGVACITPLIYEGHYSCSYCDFVSYENGNLSYNVTGFSNYTIIEGNVSLGLWDSAESSSATVNQNVWFYANYSSNGTFITGANCTILVNDSLNQMSESQSVYNYSKSFSYAGLYQWNVTCKKQDYAEIKLSDNVNIVELPNIYNFVLNSSSIYNYSTDNLTCNYILNGSATTAAISWYKNSLPIMILNLPFEGNSTNAILDYSGFSNNAIKGQDAVWQPTEGKFKTGAFDFNGTNTSYLDLTYSYVYGVDKSHFSIETLIRVDNFSHPRLIFWVGNIITGDGWGPEDEIQLSINNETENCNGFSVYAEANGGLDYCYSTGLSTNTWYHVVTTIDDESGISRLYIDGNEVANDTYTGPVNTSVNSAFIGRPASNNGGRFFDGQIDYVRLWNFSLSRQQIKELYQNENISQIDFQELKTNEIWMCKVTPFSYLFAGQTYISNNITTSSPIIFVNFTTGTPSNNSAIIGNSIFLNLSIPISAFSNVTFKIYNESGILISNKTYYSITNSSHNFTSLSKGIYYVNATVYDSKGNKNSTETRRIVTGAQKEGIAITSCENLQLNNAAYILAKNIEGLNEAGDCFYISNVYNVSFYGNGYSIINDSIDYVFYIMNSQNISFDRLNMSLDVVGQSIYSEATKNITIRNSFFSTGNVIYSVNSSFLTFKNNTMINIEHAYSFVNSTNITLESSKFFDPTCHSFIFQESSDINIKDSLFNCSTDLGCNTILQLTNTSNTQISNITIVNFYNFIYADYSSDIKFSNLKFNYSINEEYWIWSTLFYISYSSKITVENTSLTNVSASFSFDSVSDIYLKNIYEPVSSCVDSFYILSSQNITLNNISSSIDGICIVAPNSTDINLIDSQSMFFNLTEDVIQNISIEKQEYGKVKFYGLFNATTIMNITNEVNIGNNTVYINSSKNVNLNKSAIISLYSIGNRGYSNPAILRDGVVCQQCYNFTSLTANTVIFNVTGFSNYSIGESPLGNTTLTIWDLSDSITVYANYSRIYANYTNTTNEPILNAVCTMYINKTGIWRNWSDIVYNSTTKVYDLIADGGYLQGHSNAMPVGNYSYRINCTNNNGFANLSGIDEISISLYSTVLSINNSNSGVQGQEIFVYANYSSLSMPVSGIGLKNQEIGRIIWNTSDVGSGITYNTKFFDCELKGKKDCALIPNSGQGVLIYYRNGSLKKQEYSSVNPQDIAIGDLNNDSYYNEYVIADGDGRIRVYNETGPIWNYSNDARLYTVAIGDIDGDGIKDDIVVGNATNKISVFNTSDGKNWSFVWSSSIETTNGIREILLADIDGDNADDVIAGHHTFNSYVLAWKGTDGSIIWNVSDSEINSPQGLEVIDINHNGKRDDVLIGTQGDVYAFSFNGTYNAKYSVANSISNTSVPIGYIQAIAVLDLDNDGWTDDYIIGDAGNQGSYPSYILAFDNNSNYLWNHTLPYHTASDYEVWTILAKDINNDGLEEIIFSYEFDNQTYVLNKTGSLIWKYDIGQGEIGNVNGVSTGFDIGDINLDGISEILVSSRKGYLHILQDVSCIAKFNDTLNTSYNMTWNDTIRKWELKRNFTSAGEYSYNVTCEKGGYATQTAYSSFNISETAATAQLFTFDDSDTKTTYANYTKFYANYTLSNNTPITTGQCNISINKTGIWKKLGTMPYNSTTQLYEFTADCGYLPGHACIPVGNYSYNISCFDLSGTYSNLSTINNTVISLYNTTLSINNTNAIAEQNVFFYANYSNEKIKEIGRIVLDINHSAPGMAFSFIDCNATGQKKCIVTGEDWESLNELKIFWPNESLKWQSSNLNTIQNILAFDYEKQGYINDVAISSGQWYYENGSLISNGTISGLNTVIMENTIDNNSVFIYGRNEIYSYYNNGTPLWNNTLSNYITDMELIDINKDGNKDVVVSVYARNITALDGKNGTVIFESPTCAGLSLDTIDLEHSGNKSYFISADWNGDIQVFNLSGNYLYSYYGSGPDLEETAVYDFDNDGYYDDVAVMHSGLLNIITFSKIGYMSLYTKNTLCNISDGVEITDINSDGITDMLFVGQYGDICAYSIIQNQLGLLFYEKYSPLMDGRRYGKSPMSDVCDINNDGSMELGFISHSENKTYLVQEVSCIASFNDSTSYNMTWNDTIRQWQINRTFASSGKFSYNVTCEKGGYVPQTSYGSLNVSEAAPVSQLKIFDDSDFSLTYANHTKFYANYTLSNNTPITTGQCNISINKTGIWKKLGTMPYNSTTQLYEFTADCGYLPGHACIPVGNYSYNISCVDLSGNYANLSAVNNTVVSSYNTTLSINNNINAFSGQNTFFYANYSSSIMPVSGIGLNSYELGQVIWIQNYSQSNAYSVAFGDLQRDGKKDNVLFGNYGYLRTFLPNGSIYWSSPYIYWQIPEITVFDANNDSYYDDVAISEGTPTPSLYVYNASGYTVFTDSPDGGAGAITVADMDHQGFKNDIILATQNGIFVYNSSDGKNWTRLWNYSFPNIEEIIITDADRKGYEDDIAFASDSGFLVVLNNSGSLLFNTSYLFTNTFSVDAADLNHDGYRDEIFLGSWDRLSVFRFNGTYGATYNPAIQNQSIWTTTNIESGLLDILIMDLNNDGVYDDVVTGDAGENGWNESHIRAFNNNSASLWNFSVPSDGILYNEIWSMNKGDINGDGLEEILFSSDAYGAFYAINTSGKLIFKSLINKGKIGTQQGKSSAIAVSDINNDGINEIAIATENDYLYILENVNCVLQFNDSTSYNMTWNDTIRQWQINKTFASSGEYSYNITCEKGGYISQTAYFSFNVSPSHPSLKFVYPTPNNDNVTLRNYAELYVNITESNLANITYSWNQTNYMLYDDSLVVMLNFDNLSQIGENDTFVKDLSKYGNNATCSGTNCPKFNSTAGKYNGAFDFNSAASNRFIINNNPSVNFTKEMTISAWIKLKTNSASFITIAEKDATGSSFYLWQFYARASNSNPPNYPQFIVQWGGFEIPPNANESARGASVLSTNTWYHVVGTYNGTHILFYQDGLLANSTKVDFPMPFPTSNKDIWIGANEAWNEPINGIIDDLRIYNRSLSSEEVNILYNSNIRKHSNSKWTIYLNQTNITEGKYNYQFTAANLIGNMNSTEKRNISFEGKTPSISFISPTAENNNISKDNFTYINVSITEENDVSAFIDFNRSLVLWLNFENYNETGVFDNSSYKHFGKFENGLSSKNITNGPRGNALDFDGYNDIINFSYQPEFDMPNITTIEAWIYPKNKSIGNYPVVIKAISDGGPCNYWFGETINSDGPYFGAYIHNGTSGWVGNTNGPYGLNSWYHVIGIFSRNDTGTLMQVYINGVRKINYFTSVKMSTDSADLRIGWETNFYALNGTIDEIKIWNRILSPEEINASYNAGLFRLEKNFTNLADGNYSYKAYAIDAAGNVNSTEERNITIQTQESAPAIPTIVNLTLNATSIYNYTTDNLTCYYNLNGTATTAAVAWYNNRTGNMLPAMLLYLPFEGNSSNALLDYSGYSRTAVSENLTWNATAGRDGKGAFVFDLDDTIDFGDASFVENINSFSISVFVKTNMPSTTSDRRIVGKTSSQSTFALTWDQSENIAFSVWNSTGNRADSMYQNGIEDTNWHHIIAIYNKTNILVYVDGVIGNLIGNISTPTYNGDGHLTISYNGTNQNRWNGTIDDVRIYNYSLSYQQILALNNSRTNLIVSQELSAGNIWQCRVIPFSSSLAGITYESNNVTIEELPGTTTYCQNCSDCSEKIQNASNGTYIKLTQNITNQSGTCMYFNGADNLIFDCNGQTINGAGSGDAFNLNQSNSGSENIEIINCANISNFNRGIYLYYSSNVSIKNTNIFNIGIWNPAIYVYADCKNTTISNVSIQNSGYGIITGSSYITNLINVNLSNNLKPLSGCEFNITNVTAGQNHPVAYFGNVNNITFANNDSVGELILCGATNSTFENLSLGTNEVIFVAGSGFSDSSFNIFKNITLKDGWEIFHLSYGANYNNLTDIHISNASRFALVIDGSYNFAKNIDSQNNTAEAVIYRYGATNNTITDSYLYAINNPSYDGILEIYGTPVNTIVNNVTIIGNTSECVGLNGAIGSVIKNSKIGPCDRAIHIVLSGNTNSNNTFYNNLINATEHIFNPANTTQHYNTTLQSGTNIVGGNYLGGNYWTNSTGNGFSDTCEDANYNGICDLTLNASINATDYYPLASEKVPSIYFVQPTPDSDSYTSKSYVEIYTNITEKQLSSVIFSWNTTNSTLYEDSLILLMNFNNVSNLGENSTRVKDLSKNNMTASSYPNFEPTFESNCVYQGCYYYRGVGYNDYFEVLDNQILNITNKVSISAWIKADNMNGSWSIIASKGYSGSVSNYYLGYLQSAFSITFYNGSWKNHFTPQIYNNETWYFVVGMIDNEDNKVYIYVDGELIVNETETSDIYANNENLRIGAGQNGESVKGHIDELRIYNRTLSEAEIKALYMSNLKKIDFNRWQLYVNQTKNSTSGLSNGTYSYKAYAIDAAGNINSTEERNITVQTGQNTTYPAIKFVYPTPADNYNTTSRNVEIYVNITESNVSNLTFGWNSENISIYDDSLVLYMAFDNISAINESYNSSFSYVADLSRYGHKGYYNDSGDSSFNYTNQGKYGGAFRFDGTNDKITVNTTVMDNMTKFTFCAWIKPTAIHNSYPMMLTKSSIGYQGTNFYLRSGGGFGLSRWKNSTVGFWKHQSGYNVILNEWQYLCAVVGGLTSSNITLYANGNNIGYNAVQDDPSYYIDDANNTFNVGGIMNNDYPFRGFIDEVRVYNTNISAQTIKQLYITSLRKYDIDKWQLYFNKQNLDSGTYSYEAMVTNTAGNFNTTNLRYININSTIVCYNCSDCSEKIQSASTGQKIYLVNNVSINGSTCVDFNGTNNIAFDCQNNKISGNQTADTYGILISSANNNTVNSCFVEKFNYALYINYSNNIYIENSTFFNSTSCGYINYANYTTLKNNSFNRAAIAWGNLGLTLNYAYSSNLFSNRFENSSRAIQFSYSEKSNLTNNVIIEPVSNAGMLIFSMSNSRHANQSIDTTNTINGKSIYYYSGGNMNQLLRCSASMSNKVLGGMYIYYCENRSISNVTLQDGDSISCGASSNITFDNFLINNSWAGIMLSNGNSISILNTISSNIYWNFIQPQNSNNVFAKNVSNTGPINYYVSYIASSQNITYENIVINHSSNSAGIFNVGTGNQNVVIKDSVLYNYQTSSAIYSLSSNITFMNVSFNKSRILPSAGTIGTAFIKWYTDVNVSYTNGSIAGGLNINAYDNNGLLHYSNTTNSNGFARLILTEFTRNSTLNTTFNNYTINVTDGIRNASASRNVTDNVFVNLQLQTEDTTPPAIDFVYPTPANSNITPNNYVYINVSLNDTSNISAFIDFNRSLKLWLSFDNVSSNVVYDGSSYGGYANITNTTIESGKFGNSLKTSAENASGATTSSFYLNPNKNYSISFWFKMNTLSSSDSQYLVSSQLSPTSMFIFYIPTGNSVSFRAYNTTGSIQSGSVSSEITDTNWHHIVGIINGTQQILYLDGAFNASLNILGEPANGTAQYFVGKSFMDTYLFNGSIDEVMMFSRVLSYQEIQALYNSNLNKLFNNFTNLSDGTYSYKAYAIDAAGNINSTEERNITIEEPSKPAYLPIFFIPPTSENNSTQNILKINISSNATGDHSVFVDWNKSLLLWVRFDSYNSTAVFDNSSYSAVLEYKNGTNSSNVISGIRGKAFSFDGIDDLLRVSSNKPQLDANMPAITMAAWVNWTGRGDSYQRIIAKPNYNQYSIYINNDGDFGSAISAWNGTGQQINDFFVTGVKVPSNNWTFVVSTWDNVSNQIKLYINGQFMANSTLVGQYLVNGISEFYIGDRGDDNARSFNGTIDEVMVFRRALSIEEIKSLYNASKYQYDANISNIADGNYSYIAYAVDIAGNINSTEERNITIDTKIPAIYFVSPTPENNNITNKTNIEIFTNIKEENLQKIIINWNGTNKTLFDENIVLYYNFDNVSSLGESSSKVSDISTRKNNGTVVAAKYNSTGKYNGSYYFDGINSYILTKRDGLDSVDFTFSTWIKTNELDHDSVIIDNSDDGGWAGWIIAMDRPSVYNCDSGEVCVWFGNASGQGSYVDYTYDFPVGVWTHFAVSYSNQTNNVSMYINGLIVNKETAPRRPMMTDINNTRIGRMHWITRTLNGSLDEVIIWNKSLSDLEIWNIYNSYVTKKSSNEYDAFINITSYTGLNDGKYSYIEYAIDSAGNVNSTEERNITIQTEEDTTLYCQNCSDCSEKIQSATSGAYIKLNQSIIGQTGTCMYFNGADNLTFDCSENSITGTGAGYAMWLNQTNSGSENIVITNCKNISNFGNGIYLYSAKNVSVSNSNIYTINSWGYAIANMYSYNISIENVSIHNSGWGVYSNGINYNIKLTNVNLSKNTVAIDGCGFNITNVTAGTDLPVVYFENKNNITFENNESIGQLVLCQVTNSTFRNLTLINQNGIYIRTNSAYNSFFDISATGSWIGIEVNSDYNNFTDIYLFNNSRSGIQADANYLYFKNIIGIDSNEAIVFGNSPSSNCIVKDSYFYGSYNPSYHGIVELYSSTRNTLIENITVAGPNAECIGIVSGPNNNTIRNSIIGPCQTAIHLVSGSIENNTIYNSLINATTYIENSINISITLNTTLQSGANIVGGNLIGGNYWTNSTGNGFSDTCADANHDGICDNAYTVAVNATDYKPLAKDTIIYCNNCSDCSEKIQNSASDAYIRLTQNIINQSGTCIYFNGADNLTFDCNGKTINGAGSGDAINFNQSNGGSQNIVIQNCANVSSFTNGIYLYSVSNVTIQNTNLFNINLWNYGIYITSNSKNVTINNLSIHNSGYAVYASNNYITTLINVNLSNNRDSLEGCKFNITNVTAGTDLPIAYFENANNITFSNNNSIGKLILCYVENSTFTNISESYQDGIHIYNSKYNIISDIFINGTRDQAFILDSSSSYNNVTTVVIFNNSRQGFGVNLGSNYNNIRGINVTQISGGDLMTDTTNSVGNTFDDIVLSSANIPAYNKIISIMNGANNNVFKNITIKGKSSFCVGISSSSNNTFKNSYIGNCTNGIGIWDNLSFNNSFYNNIFNNTLNFNNTFNTTQYLNTTLQSDTNIIGGNKLGGNYWTNSTGNGFSDTCTDSDYNGICDSVYNIGINATDYYPLAKDYFPVINFTSPTPDNSNITSNNYAYINVSVLDASNTSAFIDWNRSLVLWMNFDSRKNDTYIYDLSSYKNNGTVYGTAIYTSEGKRGGAYLFTGTNDYVEIPYHSSLNLNNQTTMEAWFKPNTLLSGYHQIISKAGQYQLVQYNNRFNVAFLNSTGSWVNHATTKTYSENNWYHVVGIIDNINQRVLIYVNGLLELNNSETGNQQTNANPVRIATQTSGNQYINGTVDEAKIWSRALSEQEINSSYNAGLFRLERNFTNLANGNYSYKAYAIDAAGNVNSTEERNITIQLGGLSDSCNCIDSIIWNVNLFDKCVLSYDCSPTTVNMTGFGTLTIDAKLYTNYFNILTENQKDIILTNNGEIIMKTE